MSKGTILYVGGFEMPDKNAAAHRVLGNSKIFRELGYNVVFIDVDKSLSFSSNIITTYKNVQNFDCWSLPYPTSKVEWIKYLSSIDFMRVFTQKYSDIKVVVAYNYPALGLRNLKKYCSKRNIKIVADCTEWYSTKGANLVFKIIKGLDSFYRMRIIQKQLDGIIVISKYLEEYYKNCENLVRIPPLVDLHDDKWENTSDDKYKNDGHNKKLRFVYSGSPGRNKDKINYIIEALYKLQNLQKYQMDIVGITKDQFIKDYPEYKEKIRILQYNLNFIGRVSHKESLNKLKNANFSIFIRDKSRLTKAGFPTKFVESITCSTPVITNSSSNIEEYFTDSSFGFLMGSESIDELIDILKQVFENNMADLDSSIQFNNKIFHYDGYVEIVDNMLNNILR